ncbi:MAG: hypothetical protein ACUVRV_09650 [Cyanobacteriota bacterium]
MITVCTAADLLEHYATWERDFIGICLHGASLPAAYLREIKRLSI